jgi:hypothetical protein
MNRKLGMLIISVGFIFLAGCASEANRITKVLNKCEEISRQSAKFNNNPGVVANYIAAEFQRINVTRCPQDFRVAFQAHILAWQQAAPYLQDNNIFTSVLEGVAAGLTDDTQYMGQAQKNAAYASYQINITYQELTLIAAKYGARIPRSVASWD